MVDTLRLRLDVADSGGADLMSTANFIQADKMLNQSTGEMWFSGNLESFRVTGNSGSVSLEGSLPTILFPNNARILTRKEVGLAVEKLSDLLHLPLKEARVTRIDCAYHWVMSKPVPEYLERLGGLSRFVRKPVANSLYYNKGERKTKADGVKYTNSLIFYNKTKQCQDSKKDVPQVYEDSLLLRYECRWLINPSRQFGLRELKASTLSEPPFYKAMVGKWADYYFSIVKSRRGAFNFDGVKDVRGAKNWLLGYFLSRVNAANIDEVLLAMKERKVFQDPKYYTRLRRDLKEVIQKVGKESENDLIRELDSNVRSVLAYCR